MKLLFKYLFQEIAIEAALIYHDVDKSSLPFKSASELLADTKCEYSLNNRVSASSVISNFAKSLLDAQRNCKDAVHKAVHSLKTNLIDANTMDRVFGVCDDSQSARTVLRARDKRMKLQCPVPDCSVESVKLSRHLKKKHSLDDKDIKYAIKMAKTMAENCIGNGNTIERGKKQVQPP